MTHALAEAATAGWIAPAVGEERDGGDVDEDGGDSEQSPIPPSQGLLVEVSDFTRRVERPVRSAGIKRSRAGYRTPPEAASPAPMTTSNYVMEPLPVATDLEVLRRLDGIQATLGRLTHENSRLSHEVSRLASEVANLQRLSSRGVR